MQIWNKKADGSENGFILDEGFYKTARLVIVAGLFGLTVYLLVSEGHIGQAMLLLSTLGGTLLKAL